MARLIQRCVKTDGFSSLVIPPATTRHGRYTSVHGNNRGWVDVPQLVVGVFRGEGGKLAEHWDVLQDEVPVAPGGVSMFVPDEGSAY